MLFKDSNASVSEQIAILGAVADREVQSEEVKTLTGECRCVDIIPILQKLEKIADKILKVVKRARLKYICKLTES